MVVGADFRMELLNECPRQLDFAVAYFPMHNQAASILDIRPVGSW